MATQLPQQQISERELISLFSLLIDRNGGEVMVSNIDELRTCIFQMSAERVDPNTVILRTTKYIKVEKTQEVPNEDSKE